MAKTMVIHLRTGSMMNMDSNVAVKLARAALEKGYNVRMFGYGEGITVIKQGQDPKRFPNVGKEIEELAEKGVDGGRLRDLLRRTRDSQGRGSQGNQDRIVDQQPITVRQGRRPHDHDREVSTWPTASCSS